MSGNWDDSDSGSEEVEVVEKPVIIPRSRTVSVAKSLEKVQILESSVHGSQNGDDSDETSSEGSIEESEGFEETGDVLNLDFDSTTNTSRIISQFPSSYRNIISEFADVEIFLISLDSLIVELTAHKYHSWQLAGQSIVLTTQIERFLQQFVNLGGRFKLVVFTDFASLFSRDTTVAFVRATALAYIAASPYAKDLVFFTSPADQNWDRFLADLTPSFLMVSRDNFTKEVCAQEELNITPQLDTIVIHALASAIPIVLLSSITVNFATVDAYYISPKLCVKENWDSFLAAYWDCSSEPLKIAKNPTLDAKQFTTAADLWVHIIKEAKTGTCSEHFDTLACAVLLSSLLTNRRGADRIYLAEKEDAKRGLDVIRDRRTLLNTTVSILEKTSFAGIKFSLADFWDGRMILTIFDHIVTNEPVLPYRLQEEFFKLHQAAGLGRPLAVDTAERLFEPVPEPVDPLISLPLLYKTQSALIDQFVPEARKIKSDNALPVVPHYAQIFSDRLGWKLKTIEEGFAKKQEEKLEDAWQAKRYHKSRQFLSRWYENFANSLEGRGSNLLVDFSRAPKGYATKEEEEDDGKKKAKGGWAGQKPGKPGAGGGKKGKEPVKSKKDLILEANKKVKDQKVIESETKKITFATQQGKAAVTYLGNLYNTLELAETKALCIYEITMREAREFLSNLTGKEYQARRRVECVNLVGRIKDCYVKHWSHLTDRQKEQIVDLWIMLGFEPPQGFKGSSEAKSKKLDLGMNMLYYQLEYGGELIDILSDPQKDDRVTGFNPDAWQRKMLDSVDRGNSAIIVAPTSAGKTFVSYYCIEKILRASDVDVVVYVSPSKALMNQACGSIYARFKNKLMARGKSLFGTLTPEFSQSALTCQVLVTVPESLEVLLLSTNPVVQEFVSHIKYVIFDEVHSIGASENAHIWEHLLLLITCPFLALSATIGNGEKLHSWLNSAEDYKSDKKRRVDMIIYAERYSELELSIVNINKPEAETEEKKEGSKMLQPLMPFGVYMPEKLRMFGIPDDQQLTARQILTLYTTLASVDKKAKEDFEPCKYFGYKQSEFVWLSRASLRDYERKLRDRFLDWLKTDEQKMNQVLTALGGGSVKEQLDYRAIPFNKEKVAQATIVPLLDELRDEAMLPAICFNDNRHVCESLAVELVEELERREQAFLDSAEYKNKYEIKDEEKIMKAAKKKRDAAEKKKKGDKPEDEPPEEVDDSDPLAAQRAKLKQALERFKFRGRGNGDPDLYDKMVERMARQAKTREHTRLLLRLFARGIGFHHPGMNMVEKGAVEVLFRAGHLAILFSTSTLALGVNMPCKTVLFGVDNPLFTPLLYRQMSGRAGRRGFDHSGNVVFMSIPTSKIRRLLTASLSNLQGNPPFTTSFLLRLLRFVHQKDVVSQETRKAISTVQQRTQVALSLLRHSFSLYTRHEAASGVLSRQLKMYFVYSVQLLRHLQLLDSNCSGSGLAELTSHMQENEPGNLAFVHLLHQGCFHKMVKKNLENRQAAKMEMLTILANLFTRYRMPPWFNPDDKTTYPAEVEGAKNLQIHLTGLPELFQTELDKFNQLSVDLYYKFMAAASGNKQLLAPSFSTSGVDYVSARALFQRDDLVSPVFDGFSHDSKFLPVVSFDHHDHRGRKIYYNAYAVDFFIHESSKLLTTMNQLAVNKMWFMIADFNEMLKQLSEGMDQVARPHDPVCEVLRELYMDYDKKFRAAFGMSTRTKE